MLVVDPSILAEYLPPQRRGRLLVFLDFWWPVGLLFAIGLSFLFLGPNFDRFGDWSWRYLFLAAAFPALLAFVVRRTLPESPYFLARRGRSREAAEVLEEITGEPVEAGELSAPEEPESSTRELVEPVLRRRTITTALIWIALNVSYYGLFLWLPFVLQGEKSFHVDVYLLLTLSALAQFPGYAAAIWLVERIGRKPTLAGFLVLGGISAYAFAVADSEGVYVTALFFVGFFNLGAWGAVYPYTAELFPTRLRSSAFGVMECVGKAAAIAGPYLFGHLKDATGSTTWSLTFIAIVMAAGGLVAAVFGRETKGAAAYLAAGDGRDEPNLVAVADGSVEPVDLRPVDVDVHERPQPAVLVEDQVGDRQCLQGLVGGRCVELEASLAARLGGEQRGQQDYDHSAASTERISGRKRAASTHVSPPSAVAKTEPLCVPR